MKILKRVLLINWYFIIKQMIEFEQINFLTGETGAGKSTIIDALQLLFLGDLDGHFFNKSANVNSNRNLKGYLRGEITHNEKSGTIYLRDLENYPSFSSYIAAEFYDEKKKSNFTIGVVFDSFENGDYDYRYFIFKKQIPSNWFIENGTPLNIDSLKRFLKNEYKIGENTFTKIQRDYRKDLLGAFGSINNNFFSIFKKAVPFTPDINIEKFICEFVCEVNSNIDVNSMQEGFRHYKDLESKTEEIKKRIEVLENIEEEFIGYLAENDNLKVLNYAIDKASKQVISDDIDKYKRILEKNQSTIEIKNTHLTNKNADIQELEIQKDKKIEEKHNTGYDTINKQVKHVEEQIKEIEDKTNDVQRKTRSYGYEWSNNVETVINMNVSNGNDEINDSIHLLSNLQVDCKELLNINLSNLDDLNVDRLNDIKSNMVKYKEVIGKLYHKTEFSIIKLKTEENSIRSQINRLKQGKRDYLEKYINFKKELETGLEEHFGHKVQVDMLCEIIDIKDKKWANAIEAYLHSQKFDFIVEPQYYTYASQIYEKYGESKKYFDIGLVDTEKLVNSKPTADLGSLADEIISENKYAKAYANFILGRVKKCYDIKAIRNNKIAITQSCMLYQNFVLRLLDERRWKYPYIGGSSQEIQLKLKTKELEELLPEISELSTSMQKLDKLNKIEPISDWVVSDILSTFEKTKKLCDLEKQLQELSSKLGKIPLLYINKLEEEIEGIRENIKLYTSQKDKLKDEILKLQIINDNLLNTTIPEFMNSEKNAKKKITDTYFDNAWVNDFGEPRYIGAITHYRSSQKLIEEFEILVGVIDLKKKKIRDSLENKKRKYNEDFHLSFDPYKEDNIEFKKDYSRLVYTEMPKYLEDFKDSKMKAFEQFRDEFIGKLQSNIATVIEQIKDINISLKDSTFGRDLYYKFTYQPNPDYKTYYDMITDPMFYTGFYTSSPEIQERYEDTLDSLFKQIIDVSETDIDSEIKKNLEKNIKLYTDYRTYLKFDLKVIKDNGLEESLSTMLLKKSGGETQTPFYICILASFFRTYMMKQRERYSNTIRLIMFDEAFSKMDHKRIPESINLLKSFGFQTILSAPSEKIGDISPIVDKTILVMRVDDEIVTKEFNSKEVKNVMGDL